MTAQPSLFDAPLPHFNGPEYDYERDHQRLSGQYRDIFNLMRDQEWRTLPEIARLTGHPEASISAQLRHMRKPRFGLHTVNRRHISHGLFEYQLVVNRSRVEVETGHPVGNASTGDGRSRPA